MDPFTIPIIADAIALHLDLTDLTQCVLVCKTWHRVFSRSLWASINLDNSFSDYMYGPMDDDDELVSPVEPLPTPPDVPAKTSRGTNAMPKRQASLAQFTARLRRIKRVMVDRCIKSNKRRDPHPSTSMVELGKSVSDESTEAISHPIPLPQFTEAFTTGFESNGQHVRHVQVTLPDLLPHILRYTPNLSSLFIQVDIGSEWSAISKLAENTHIRLTSLEIIALTLPYHWHAIIAKFEHLESLRLVNQHTPTSIEDLIRSVWRCRQLRRLRLVCPIRADVAGPFDSSAGASSSMRCFTESLIKQIEPLRALIDLDLRFKDTASLQDDFFLPFLKLASNVKSLYPPNLTRAQSPHFVQAIETYCRQIEVIDFTYLSYLTDADIAAVVKACSRDSMRELLLTGSTVGAETMAAIAECQSQSMEKLSIEHSQSPVPSASIQSVLASCTRLREFKAGSQGWKGQVRLDAADIIRAPWACHQHLEYLAVCVVGCSTPSLQNAVFDQLAQLTRLKSLDLSETLNETQKDVNERGGSLVWTLDSGMTKLASLTQMEYLWLLSGHFDLGEREREWINQHWPNLFKSAGVW
ncbi:hypothetical protein DFQ27_000063 [Actinomortierella ambigua]|uniref:F-box domain-containing protein n=1 Tax=Actinomortierella ambigua TaxID=1343610 RepID=A0A9P6UDF8_9FUNG|nr:hypothetical protein DFQ27_000063 [Actinomortierella ambigua]